MAALVSLTLAEASRIVREATKDKSYRATPLGLEVARYYRWKKNEWGATEETMRDYEAILAKTSLHFADLELRDFEPPIGTERLRECWDHYWGDRSGRTRAKVRSVWIDFFEWAGRERGMHGNPARRLAIPKKRDVQIETFPPSLVDLIIGAQDYPADWIGATLILKYGVRRGGVAKAQRKHFDFERRQLTVFAKGGRIYQVPLPEESFWLKVGELDLEAQWQPEQYLMYRQDVRRIVGQGEIIKRTHWSKLPTQPGRQVHRWWYRCLERAGLVDKGVMAGMNMHRGRHTSATEFLRHNHDLKLTQKLLGHADIASTSRYAQLDDHDLAAALTELYGAD